MEKSSTITRIEIMINKFIYTLIFSIITVGVLIPNCNGHGRLIEPPSRSSAWRYGFQTPPNYNDHELYCGGFTRQQKNGGKCGECGDAWDLPEPRPNEFGGRWGQGVVVRKYKSSEEITLRIELTASHMGYFEFRVCPDIKAKQDCLDKYILELEGGTPSSPHPADLSTRFYPRNGSRIYEIKGKLPNGLECPNCVLQWRYIAGNNWGMCPDGTGAVGCGAQEEFRACADITIGDVELNPPLRPLRPTTKTTHKLTSTTASTPADETESTDDEIVEEPYYLGTIIIILTLLCVICGFSALYLYYYHGKRIKQLMKMKREQKTTIIPFPSAHPPNIMETNPIPPPRAKRLSQPLRGVNISELNC